MTSTQSYWIPQRLIADPDADAIVASMIPSVTFTSVRHALGQLMRNSSLRTDERLPTDLREFLIIADDLPSWFDAQKIEIAQRVFGDFGVEICFVLLLKSLPECYTMKNGSVVLEKTGRLMMDDRRKSAYTHRVMMTLQFVTNVMAQNGFSQSGNAIESILKVRLVHACIRHFIREQIPDWDTKSLGVPINQEDLTFTLTTFSVSVVKGLEMMGVIITDEEREAVNHLWAVAATMLGISHENIPQTYTQAVELQQYFFSTQGGYSEAGNLLTQSLVEFAEGMLPGVITSRFVRHVAYLFLGPVLSNYVGLHVGKNGELTVADQGIRLILKVVSWLIQQDNFIGRIAQRVTKFAVTFVIKHFTSQTSLDFELPDNLKN